MSSNAAQILPLEHTAPHLALVSPAVASPAAARNHIVLAESASVFSVPGREMLVLAIVLGILQIADGVLTGIGVYHLGIGMEGNPLLRILMEYCGAIPTLVIVKTGALMIIAALTTLSGTVAWLTLAMRGMVALYTVCAVIPWSAILYGYFS